MLYLVPTPIGNLGDMTLRAIETLKQVDLIYAEDTRRTRQLLNHFEIDKKLCSYYEHNKDRAGDAMLQDLRSGKDIALVSDAGMPCISDPGLQLVKDCIEHRLPFTVLPGATAFATAFVGSGITSGVVPSSSFAAVPAEGSATVSAAFADDSAGVGVAIPNDICVAAFAGVFHGSSATVDSAVSAAPSLPASFCFMGFPPKTKKHKKQVFSAIARDCRPHIFYESPHAIRDTLAVMNEVLGQRTICLARELTKIHEEYLRGSIEEMLSYFETTEPKGEFVIVIEGAKYPLQDRFQNIVHSEFQGAVQNISEKIRILIRSMLKRNYSVKDISELISEFTGERKKVIYNLILEIKEAEDC